MSPMDLTSASDTLPALSHSNTNSTLSCRALAWYLCGFAYNVASATQEASFTAVPPVMRAMTSLDWKTRPGNEIGDRIR